MEMADLMVLGAMILSIILIIAVGILYLFED